MEYTIRQVELLAVSQWKMLSALTRTRRPCGQSIKRIQTKGKKDAANKTTNNMPMPEHQMMANTRMGTRNMTWSSFAISEMQKLQSCDSRKTKAKKWRRTATILIWIHRHYMRSTEHTHTLSLSSLDLSCGSGIVGTDCCELRGKHT